MEVVLELYRTLEILGIQWREKRGIWAVRPEENPAPSPQGRNHSPQSDDPDASDSFDGEAKEDLDIYFIECRWRVRDVIVRVPNTFYAIRREGLESYIIYHSYYSTCNCTKLMR